MDRSLALHVLGDDEQLLTGLDQLLQQRQNVGDHGDLLVGDEDIRIVDEGFHLVGVGDHIGGDVAPVELHALHHLGIGLGGLGLLDGDDAIGGDLLHGLGDELADEGVAGGDGADSCDVVGAVDLLALLVDGGHGGVHGLGHALLHDDGIGAGGQVLQTLADHGLGQQGSGGGTVAGHVVGLGGHLAHQLSAHVLKRIVQLDLLGDGHAVVGDQGRAELLIQHHVAALGAQGDLYGIGQLKPTPRSAAPLRASSP